MKHKEAIIIMEIKLYKKVQQTNLNDITDVFLINKGSGYIYLPKVSITSSGTNANVLAHGTEIGRVIGLKTNELGEGYQNSPSTLLNLEIVYC